MTRLRETVRVPIATAAGLFDVHAFELPSGSVYLALVRGELGDGRSVLVRLHSECLTGDALGSLRCDCGVQLRWALRRIAAEGRGVLLYATGQEGRGIGLVNKLRAYVLQDRGADTVDANRLLGWPVDDRDYDEACRCLQALGVASVRLLTNNPAKVDGLVRGGIPVEERIPLPTAGHVRNFRYVETKEQRLGHVGALGEPPVDGMGPPPDVRALLGPVRLREGRPFVVLKYAQTLDGRIATRTGDARWISGPRERAVAHALRAACDAVLVGAGTVLADDPRLTVRLVPGASPIRVVLDGRLRTAPQARVYDPEAPTVVLTTPAAPPERRERLRGLGVVVREVPAGAEGVELSAGLRALAEMGIGSVLVEGGARVLTSFLRAGLADRVVVSVAPSIMGAGREAVEDLGVRRVSDAVRLDDMRWFRAGSDLLVSGAPRT
ncbi:MAG TPA: GTP cyclohydrolase II RibA [Actinomycetota bacterium]|nr:GTP cyclohydrolase II RibA [Actinomycetota bacterium]